MLLDTKLPNNRSGRVVEIQCDSCGVHRNVNWNNYEVSQVKRNFSGETLCRSCSCKKNAKSRVGKPSWNKGVKLPPDKKGKNHHSWRGGRYIDVHGYVMVHIGEKTGRSKWSSYRKEHLVLMEDFLDRKLQKGEIIHHIDGNRQNNSLNNLFLCCNSTHRDAHQSLQELGYELIKSGDIVFNVEEGVYEFKRKGDK